MTLRALIVLLAALNLGVAAWWLLRGDPAPAASEEASLRVARLQLVRERPGAVPANANKTAAEQTTSAPTPVAAGTQAQPPAAGPERCISIGPFADAAALASAQTALRPGALRLRTRETREGGGRGWRVYLPAAADRVTADAAADRLRAAGFTDLLVVGDGAEANSIALGRFSGEPRAQLHAEALRTAGFAAKAEPLGDVRTSRWIDLTVAATFDLAAARRASGAAQSRTVDCARVRR